MQATKVIDARGSFCPGPMMELVRAIKSANVGDVIELISNDKGSEKEIPSWISRTSHKLLEIQQKGDEWHFFVQKGERKKGG